MLLNFNPRPPRGGRLCKPVTAPPEQIISIHALREEGDVLSFGTALNFFNFNPRPPRGGRQISYAIGPCEYLISIHALREEGDLANAFDISSPILISIHALREEGDAGMQFLIRWFF